MIGRIFVRRHMSNSSQITSSVLCALTVIVLISHVSAGGHQFRDMSKLCWRNLSTDEWLCRPVCHYGYFSLPGMKRCYQWLGCEHINTVIEVGDLIGNGAVKMIFKAFWKDFTFALNIASREEYYPDYKHGKSMITRLQPNPHVIQLIGACGTRYLTEYHHLTSADKFLHYITSDKYKHHDSLELRYQLCMDYLHILDLLHNGSIGTRVLCDSNDLKKMLSQFLLRSDFRLIYNDMDALPEVNHTANRLIKCGHKEITGDFVAPEQLWPYPEKEFSDDEMPPYDEKTDIWKIPSIFNYFLDSRTDAASIKLHLFHIHLKCREENPKLRPTVREVITEYKQAWNSYKNQQNRRTEL